MPFFQPCAHCQTPFQVKPSQAANKRFCSSECRIAVKSRLLICGYCGKEFSVPQRRSETVKFCSWECRVAGGNKTVPCAKCGRSFVQKQHQKHLYCSNECSYAMRAGRVLTLVKRQRHFKNCEVCGSSFRLTVTRERTARFCSRKCQATALGWDGRYKDGYGYAKTSRVGPNGPRFIHRILVEQALIAAEPNHHFLVENNEVKRLDRKVEVHHIDRNRSNNDLSNLLAVTKKAHAQIHTRNRKPDPWECWPPHPDHW